LRNVAINDPQRGRERQPFRGLALNIGRSAQHLLGKLEVVVDFNRWRIGTILACSAVQCSPVSI
jgi:hypothetical protein